MKRVLVACATLVVCAAPALADEGGSTSRDGKTLSVSKVAGLRVEGERVRVTGRGYDRSKGIYVAFCVDNGPGRVPTPCGGGADTEGRSGNSVWVSDLPPAYGTGLAQPYGEGGTFDVTIAVRAQLNDEVDCRVVRCAVVTRNDHTRSDDRSQDLAVPVSFGAVRALPPRARATPRPATGSPAAPTTAAPPGSVPASPAAATASPPAPASTAAPAAAGGVAATTPAATAVTAAAADGPGAAPGRGPGLPALVAGAVLAAAAVGAATAARRRVAGSPQA